ncbi:MAG: DUF4398 domain-containing protein [Desulfobacterium sp.]|nr:DUF4398 domain-containing protein [Desulfobacterium sp.]MBU3949796.1 DUF4398 domain-containing protein [Pseudomonadota bacterium]MBU4035842.1 DUF4398 domain-containing protein [Pseudomonadota bacterium]
MKGIMKYLALIMVTIFLFAGCAKEPTEDINSAKAAVDTVKSEDAQKYVPEDVKNVNDTMQAAEDEIKVQKDKLFKDYSKAKELLAKAKADAEALNTNLAAKKEEVKNNATAAQESAKYSIEEAKGLLEQAPKGKGSMADIEAFKADLKGLEDSLVEVQAAMDSSDYNAAIEKANAIKEKATAISDQVKAAMEKVGELK